MNRLVLIDGNAVLHRAYHALPPLTTPDGTMVNAVYGFISMLIKIRNDFAPTHIAVAFDRPEPTFRKTLYKEYQATRPKMEDNLAAQIALVHDVVASFGIPVFEAAGYEADDVMGSLAAQAQSSKLKTQSAKIDEVIIVTGDKDILQLVDDKLGVKVFMPTKGLSEGKLYGEAEVREKFGVSPKQIPDLKALMGDSSDNYPGVAGVGPKTAEDLVNSFESIQKLYDQGERGDWGDVGDRIKIKLLAGKENAFLSRDLATIRTDAPVEVGELRTVATLDTPEAREKLEEFHFPSLMKRLAGARDRKAERQKGGETKRAEEKHTQQQELF